MSYPADHFFKCVSAKKNKRKRAAVPGPVLLVARSGPTRKKNRMKRRCFYFKQRKDITGKKLNTPCFLLLRAFFEKP